MHYLLARFEVSKEDISSPTTTASQELSLECALLPQKVVHQLLTVRSILDVPRSPMPRQDVEEVELK